MQSMYVYVRISQSVELGTFINFCESVGSARNGARSRGLELALPVAS
jgi:hypothetical protein